MTTTPKVGAPELATSQASKELTHNEALRYIEQGGRYYVVKDKDMATPPGSPADGDAYIVAGSPTGAWVGWAGRIAFYLSTAWVSILPEEGVLAYAQDENALYTFDGGSSPGAWVAFTASPGAITLEDLSDVTTNGKLDGWVLTYDTDSPGGWKAQPLPGTGATTLDGLTDVDTSSSPGPANGDVLTYNSALGLWIPGTPRREWYMEVAASDESTALTAGTAKITFRTNAAVVLEEVRASLTTAQTSGGQLVVDVNEAGVSVLSTKVTFDNGSKTSVGSSPSAVISDTALADNAEMSIDIDNIGDGTAKGLKVLLKGRYA